MGSRIDNKGTIYNKNIAIWYDGTLRAAKGHQGECRWFFDGQIWYQLRSSTLTPTRMKLNYEGKF